MSQIPADPLFRQELLDEAKSIVNSIGQVLPVTSAYFFGSGLNGVFTEDSDLDLIVVIEDQFDLKRAQQIAFSKRWTNRPLDLILKSESEFNQRKELGGVCFVAFHDGLKLK